MVRLILSEIWHSSILQYFVPAKAYIQWEFKRRMGYPLNLKQPKTYSEKLQWLKLYDKNPIYSVLSDKWAAREYVARIIGPKYLVPIYGKYRSANDIPFQNLPSEYVLKCTHDSGTVIVKDDRCNLTNEQIKVHFRKALKRNYYYVHREWPYKNIKPAIICEKKVGGLEGSWPIDYKFFCFYGEPLFVLVCSGRETGYTKFYHYSEEWRLIPFQTDGQPLYPPVEYARPKQLDQMFNIARNLSKPFLTIRVDLYNENGRIYFSEFTLYPQAGYYGNCKEADILMGNAIKHPMLSH